MYKILLQRRKQLIDFIAYHTQWKFIDTAKSFWKNMFLGQKMRIRFSF